METTLLTNVVAALVSGCHLPKSCNELLEMNPSASDGKYSFDFNGQEAVIYCHNMTTGSPREYINLVQENSFHTFATKKISEKVTIVIVNMTTYYNKVAINMSVSYRSQPSEELELTANSLGAHIEILEKLIVRTLSYFTVNSQDDSYCELAVSYL